MLAFFLLSRLFFDDEAASRFDIAYLIAKENMAFVKMVLCANLKKGTAQEQRQGLVASLSRARFFGLKADGSIQTLETSKTKSSVYCDPRAADGRVHVRSQKCFGQTPCRANAEGLFVCLKAGLDYMGVSDWEKKLIGFGCDGASVNMGACGLRGFLQASMPWIFFVLCPSLRAI